MLGIKGGYGSAHLLKKFPYKKNNFPIMGYSDLTSLLIAINQITKQTTYYGFMFLPNFENKFYKSNLNCLIKFLKNKKSNYNFTLKENQLLIIPTKKINVQGISICGCLSILSTLCGTKYFKQYKKDNIFFIEDINEEPYKIDRMLTHLKNCGIFKKTKCLFFDFKNCKNSKKNKNSINLKNTLLEIFKEYDFPIINLPKFGHRENKIILPIGKKINISFTKNNLNIKI